MKISKALKAIGIGLGTGLGAGLLFGALTKGKDEDDIIDAEYEVFDDEEFEDDEDEVEYEDLPDQGFNEQSEPDKGKDKKG